MQAGIAERKIAVVQQRLADALQVLEPAGAAGPAAGDGSLPAGGADALRPAAGGPEPAAARTPCRRTDDPDGVCAGANGGVRRAGLLAGAL